MFVQSVPAVTSPAGSTGGSMGALASTPLRPMDRQIETRTSDGKRRITPVFIPLTNADAKLVLPAYALLVLRLVIVGGAFPACFRDYIPLNSHALLVPWSWSSYLIKISSYSFF